MIGFCVPVCPRFAIELFWSITERLSSHSQRPSSRYSLLSQPSSIISMITLHLAGCIWHTKFDLLPAGGVDQSQDVKDKVIEILNGYTKLGEL